MTKIETELRIGGLEGALDAFVRCTGFDGFFREDYIEKWFSEKKGKQEQVEKLIEECDKELGHRDWDTEWNDGVKARYMGLILEVME